MHINSTRLRELRIARQWSQDQLAKLSDLNLRTIQRLESGAKISTESLRALAAVLEVPADSLLMSDPIPSQQALKAMREGVLRGLEFTGTSSRTDFWWFALAVLMLLALAKLLEGTVGLLPIQTISLLVLLPLIDACATQVSALGGNSSAWCRWWASWFFSIYSAIRQRQGIRSR